MNPTKAAELFDPQVDPTGLPPIFLAVIASVDAATGTYTLTLPGDSTATGKKFRGIRSAFIETLAVSDLVLCAIAGHSILILGKVGTSLNFTLSAPSWNGVRWVKPGTTNTDATLATEQTTTSTSYVTVKKWQPSRPGMYRVTFDLRRVGSFDTVRARLVKIVASGDVVALHASEATTTSTSDAAQTLNMTVNVYPSEVIALQLKVDSGSGTGAVNDVVAKYDFETAASVTVSANVIAD